VGTSGLSSKSPPVDTAVRLQRVYRSGANGPVGASQQFREVVDVAGYDRHVQ